jgi:UDP-N-acetylglucosamine--N-acetylmuramyl-(pentapeptide) pyrophosphoryl-undecaprenol N-acetylglucosamine transferase
MLVKEKNMNGVYVSAFIDRMDYAYAAADAVVSRAGAIAVSEISAVHKPAILIPSPHVAEDHQTKNAMALVNNHAAILIKDHEALDKLGNVATDLLLDEEKKQMLKVKIASLAYRDAADVIAEAAIGLINE